ncbi:MULTISPECIES: purine/pyrimidine permease [Pontibacillus]|uniref:Purine/pyrimidine permease n=1 Tax=Pontibacillus chungwhensis TaxID=265426 RepID=A0ABY8UXP9_9BACI|nr:MULTISPECIES: purine/pyrimidine permease [Pontibacillus]MCD5325991.1 purine/pyrimidine permease [Pontibacillus sp. HN14]WIF98445.1 purine/pyrimidine permease [Pontibacillus chungwhensis]
MSSKATFSTNTMETFQWFVFLLASSVAMPIVIGSIYQLDFIEISGLMQRTFFTVGIASLLQALFGHKLPIFEGPAGIWVSIFSVMAITGIQAGGTYKGTLQTLEATMIVTGIFLFLFGAFKISQKILPIFTPLVTGTFFLLLTVQLSGTFLKGMLGLQGEASVIQGEQSLLAFLTFFIVLGLSTFARGWLSSYAVFIGIIIGWIAFRIVVGGQGEQASVSLFAAPEWFAFGAPAFDFSIIPIAFITAIISISNIVASIVAVKQTLGMKQEDHGEEVNKGTAFSGINHGIAGVFASVANVPLATSAGFIALTGQKRKQPFIYATILLIIIAFFPPIVAFISSIPAPIANAALMASFVQLVGLALNNVTMQPLDSRKSTIVGVAYLFGMATMFLPAEVFSDLPALAQNLMSNGLLIGTGLVILFEQAWKVKED